MYILSRKASSRHFSPPHSRPSRNLNIVIHLFCLPEIQKSSTCFSVSSTTSIHQLEVDIAEALQKLYEYI